MASAKIAVSIDAKLLARVERVRAGTGESRSALVSRALARLTDEDAKAHAIRQYVDAYRTTPESAREVAAARRAAKHALAGLSWDDA